MTYVKNINETPQIEVTSGYHQVVDDVKNQPEGILTVSPSPNGGEIIVLEGNVINEVGTDALLEKPLEISDKDAVEMYLSDPKVRGNLIDFGNYCIKKLGKTPLTFNTIVAKLRINPEEIRMHLRLMALIGLVYEKVYDNKQIKFVFTPTPESRIALLEGEILWHNSKIVELTASVSELKTAVVKESENKDKQENQ